MKKINVVKENTVFNHIIKKSKYVNNRDFVIYYDKKEPSVYHFGISVGKKIGNAVIRNKMKRKVRNIIDNHKKLYANNLDYIIIVRKNCLNLSFKQMDESFVSLIEKIKKEENYE